MGGDEVHGGVKFYRGNAAAARNYVEADRTGAVSKNTTGFTAGRQPLYQIVAGASTITSYTDYRFIGTPTDTWTLFDTYLSRWGS